MKIPNYVNDVMIKAQQLQSINLEINDFKPLQCKYEPSGEFVSEYFAVAVVDGYTFMDWLAMNKIEHANTDNAVLFNIEENGSTLKTILIAYEGQSGNFGIPLLNTKLSSCRYTAQKRVINVIAPYTLNESRYLKSFTGDKACNISYRDGPVYSGCMFENDVYMDHNSFVHLLNKSGLYYVEFDGTILVKFSDRLLHVFPLVSYQDNIECMVALSSHAQFFTIHRKEELEDES